MKVIGQVTFYVQLHVSYSNRTWICIPLYIAKDEKSPRLVSLDVFFRFDRQTF